MSLWKVRYLRNPWALQSSYQCFLCLTEQLLEFMHQLPAFANMTMSVRRELCSVMIFEVVEQAGAIILEDGQEVSYCLQHSLGAIGSRLLARASGGKGLFAISAALPHLKVWEFFSHCDPYPKSPKLSPSLWEILPLYYCLLQELNTAKYRHKKAFRKSLPGKC